MEKVGEAKSGYGNKPVLTLVGDDWTDRGTKLFTKCNILIFE